MNIDKAAYLDRLSAIAATREEFPSLEHKIAWSIAIYFKEDYSFWVRQVKKTYLLIGQVEFEFNNLKGKPYGKRDKVRMLLRSMFPR